MFDLPPTPIRFTAYAMVLLAFGLCVYRPKTDVADNPAYDALSKALTRKIVSLTTAKDSLEKVAHKAKVVHVAAQEKATKAVEDLPPAKIVGATLSLPEGDFTVPMPVIRYVGQLQHTVAVMDTAAKLGSAALGASERAREAGDSLNASLTLDRDRWRLTAESLRPSRLDLFVRHTLPVVGFVAGLYVGSRVTR